MSFLLLAIKYGLCVLSLFQPKLAVAAELIQRHLDIFVQL